MTTTPDPDYEIYTQTTIERDNKRVILNYDRLPLFCSLKDEEFAILAPLLLEGHLAEDLENLITIDPKMSLKMEIWIWWLRRCSIEYIGFPKVFPC